MRAAHYVTNNLRVYDLADDSLVCDAHDKSVPRRCKLVVVLYNHAPPGQVVCFALPPASVFNLVAFEVRIILDNFDEAHRSGFTSLGQLLKFVLYYQPVQLYCNLKSTL